MVFKKADVLRKEGKAGVFLPCPQMRFGIFCVALWMCVCVCQMKTAICFPLVQMVFIKSDIYAALRQSGARGCVCVWGNGEQCSPTEAATSTIAALPFLSSSLAALRV